MQYLQVNVKRKGIKLFLFFLDNKFATSSIDWVDNTIYILTIMYVYMFTSSSLCFWSAVGVCIYLISMLQIIVF